MKSSEDFVLKLGDKKNGISLRASTLKKGNRNDERNQLVIEMTSAALKEESEAVKNNKSIWPSNVEIVASGRLRNIEADSETIESIEEWAESKGMNCL